MNERIGDRAVYRRTLQHAAERGGRALQDFVDVRRRLFSSMEWFGIQQASCVGWGWLAYCVAQEGRAARGLPSDPGRSACRVLSFLLTPWAYYKDSKFRESRLREEKRRMTLPVRA